MAQSGQSESSHARPLPKQTTTDFGLWRKSMIPLVVLLAMAQPVAKIGQCPSGYASGASYCTPLSDPCPLLALSGHSVCAAQVRF
jgi:hypothetical protein